LFNSNWETKVVSASDIINQTPENPKFPSKQNPGTSLGLENFSLYAKLPEHEST
jgi:hypothetical protein